MEHTHSIDGQGVVPALDNDAGIRPSKARGIKRRFENRSNEIIAVCVTGPEKLLLKRLAEQKRVSLSAFITGPWRDAGGVLEDVERPLVEVG